MCAGLMLFGPVQSEFFKHLCTPVLYLVGSWQQHLFSFTLSTHTLKKRPVPHFNWKDWIFFPPPVPIVVASKQEVLSLLEHNQLYDTVASPQISWLFHRWHWLLVQLQWACRDSEGAEISKNVLEQWCFSPLNPFPMISSSLPGFVSADFCLWLMSHVECEGQDIVPSCSQVS